MTEEERHAVDGDDHPLHTKKQQNKIKTFHNFSIRQMKMCNR